MFRICFINNSDLNLLTISSGDRIEQDCGLRESCLTFKNSYGVRSSLGPKTGGRIFTSENMSVRENEWDMSGWRRPGCLSAQLACGLLYKTWTGNTLGFLPEIYEWCVSETKYLTSLFHVSVSARIYLAVCSSSRCLWSASCERPHMNSKQVLRLFLLSPTSLCARRK